MMHDRILSAMSYKGGTNQLKKNDNSSSDPAAIA